MLQAATVQKRPTEDNRMILKTAACACMFMCWQVDGMLWAAVGSWATYEVSLWHLSPGGGGAAALVPVLRLPTSHPRSLLVTAVGGPGRGGASSRRFLFAASASGEVVASPLFADGTDVSLGTAAPPFQPHPPVPRCTPAALEWGHCNFAAYGHSCLSS